MKLMRLTIGFALTAILLAGNPRYVAAQTSELVRLTAEVRDGEAFEKPFGSGLIFRLAPSSDAATPGWRIEVYSAPAKIAREELSWVVTPPYRGNNPRYILVAYGQSAKEVVAHTPRHFRFVTTLLDHSRASAAVGKFLWPAGFPEERLEAARQQLDAIPKGDGKLSITAFKLIPSESSKPVRIAWLKFEVELSIPPARRPQLPLSARSIREAPLEEALAEAFLADVTASNKCPEDRLPAEINTRSFGDLDGDSVEEVALTGRSCLSGSGGADLFLVLKLLPKGELTRLELPPPEDGQRACGSWRESHGYMGLIIEDGKLIEVFPVYRPGDPECCPSGGQRKRVFKWGSKKFILKDSFDLPGAPK